MIYKAAIRSNTERAAYVESHAIEGTRRGMFGDQFPESERKKLRGFLPRPKRTPRSAAAATVVAVSCAGCSNLHAMSDLAKGYCITCWSNWRQQSIGDRLPPTKPTIPEPDPESDPEPVHKKQKTSKKKKKKTNEEMEEEKSQGSVDKAPIAKTSKQKKKKKKTETELLQQEPDIENESPAETDKQKPAELIFVQIIFIE